MRPRPFVASPEPQPLHLLTVPELPLWGATLMVAVASGLVVASAHRIVTAAAAVAGELGVSHTVVGLTVVAAGTSAPEFAVTLLAAFEGKGSISVGNVVGSNIFNLGFILGGVALVAPMDTVKEVVYRDGMVLAAATVALFAAIASNLTLDRGEGLLLFAALLIYLWYLVVQSGRRIRYSESKEKTAGASGAGARVWKGALHLAVGLLVLVVSAQFLIEGATSIAGSLGVSEWVIGVTVIAAGTSLPEFATALVAVVRKHHGIGLGSIIGSDIYNVLGVLGITGLMRSVEVDQAAVMSLAGLSLMVFVTLVFLRTGWRLSRLEGLVLVMLALARWVLDLSARA